MSVVGYGYFLRAWLFFVGCGSLLLVGIIIWLTGLVI